MSARKEDVVIDSDGVLDADIGTLNGQLLPGFCGNGKFMVRRLEIKCGANVRVVDKTTPFLLVAASDSIIIDGSLHVDATHATCGNGGDGGGFLGLFAKHIVLNGQLTANGGNGGSRCPPSKRVLNKLRTLDLFKPNGANELLVMILEYLVCQTTTCSCEWSGLMFGGGGGAGGSISIEAEIQFQKNPGAVISVNGGNYGDIVEVTESDIRTCTPAGGPTFNGSIIIMAPNIILGNQRKRFFCFCLFPIILCLFRQLLERLLEVVIAP